MSRTWAVAARFSTLGEAESARSALAAAGIESRAADENTIAIDWLYSNALGGIKVLVPEDQVDEAGEVLSLPAGDVPEGAEEVPETAVEADDIPAAAERCVACGSSDVQRVPRLKLFAALAVIAGGVGVAAQVPGLALALFAAAGLIAATTPSRRCRQCGERWNATDAPEPVAGAPPPEPSDRVDPVCPHCGARELYRISYRRLEALPLFVWFAIIVVPIWLVLPRWKCDSCGRRAWRRR